MSSLVENATERPGTTALYTSFLTGCIFVYMFLQAEASGTFDCILTLSAGLQAFGFALLICDARSPAAEELSPTMLSAFLIAHVARLSTTLWGEGYVPEDNTADVCLYQSLEVFGVVMLAYNLLTMSAVPTMHDAGQGAERWTMLIGMVALAMAMAVVTKSTAHNHYVADLSWMFSVWLDAFALGPQVRLLAAPRGQLDESAVHFAFATLAASLAFGAFWWKHVADQYSHSSRGGYRGFLIGITVAAILRVCLCGVYLRLFLRSPKSFRKPKDQKGTYELCSLDMDDDCL